MNEVISYRDLFIKSRKNLRSKSMYPEVMNKSMNVASTIKNKYKNFNNLMFNIHDNDSNNFAKLKNKVQNDENNVIFNDITNLKIDNEDLLNTSSMLEIIEKDKIKTKLKSAIMIDSNPIKMIKKYISEPQYKNNCQNKKELQNNIRIENYDEADNLNDSKIISIIETYEIEEKDKKKIKKLKHFCNNTIMSKMRLVSSCKSCQGSSKCEKCIKLDLDVYLKNKIFNDVDNLNKVSKDGTIMSQDSIRKVRMERIKNLKRDSLLFQGGFYKQIKDYKLDSKRSNKSKTKKQNFHLNKKDLEIGFKMEDLASVSSIDKMGEANENTYRKEEDKIYKFIYPVDTAKDDINSSSLYTNEIWRIRLNNMNSLKEENITNKLSIVDTYSEDSNKNKEIVAENVLKELNHKNEINLEEYENLGIKNQYSSIVSNVISVKNSNKKSNTSTSSFIDNRKSTDSVFVFDGNNKKSSSIKSNNLTLKQNNHSNIKKLKILDDISNQNQNSGNTDNHSENTHPIHGSLKKILSKKKIKNKNIFRKTLKSNCNLENSINSKNKYDDFIQLKNKEKNDRNNESAIKLTKFAENLSNNNLDLNKQISCKAFEIISNTTENPIKKTYTSTTLLKKDELPDENKLNLYNRKALLFEKYDDYYPMSQDRSESNSNSNSNSKSKIKNGEKNINKHKIKKDKSRTISSVKLNKMQKSSNNIISFLQKVELFKEKDYIHLEEEEIKELLNKIKDIYEEIMNRDVSKYITKMEIENNALNKISKLFDKKLFKDNFIDILKMIKSKKYTHMLKDYQSLNLFVNPFGKKILNDLILKFQTLLIKNNKNEFKLATQLLNNERSIHKKCLEQKNINENGNHLMDKKEITKNFSKIEKKVIKQVKKSNSLLKTNTKKIDNHNHQRKFIYEVNMNKYDIDTGKWVKKEALRNKSEMGNFRYKDNKGYFENHYQTIEKLEIRRNFLDLSQINLDKFV